MVSADGQYQDRELQQAFAAHYDPAQHPVLRADPTEVQQLEAVTPAQFPQWLTTHRDQLVPWFLADLQHLDLAHWREIN